MGQSSFGAMLAAAAFLVAAVAFADQGSASDENESALEQSMGDIQWGWSPKQVYKHLSKGIEASYAKSISKATDAIEEDRLRHKMREEMRVIRDSYFKFDGTPSAYDAGFLKNEFTHNNGESLLRVKKADSQDYFFFINDRLWKRYRAFDAAVFEGATFEQFGEALQGRYGTATKKSRTSVPSSEKIEWYEWREPRVLARALDNTEFYGFYCLVLDDPKTVAKLDRLRKNKPAKNAKNKSILDLVVEEETVDQNANIADRISGEIRQRESADVNADK